MGFVALAATSAGHATEPGWTVPKLATVDSKPFLVPPPTPYVDPSLASLPGSIAPMTAAPAAMTAVAKIGRQWGTVTSILRSVEHNRKVGGVSNSYHLSGRAIDIARRPGVRHAEIDAALRRAGFRPVESLDEGDHSHFAFARAGEVVRAAAVVKPLAQLAAAEENGQLRLRLSFRSPRTGGR